MEEWPAVSVGTENETKRFSRPEGQGFEASKHAGENSWDHYDEKSSRRQRVAQRSRKQHKNQRQKKQRGRDPPIRIVTEDHPHGSQSRPGDEDRERAK